MLKLKECSRLDKRRSDYCCDHCCNFCGDLGSVLGDIHDGRNVVPWSATRTPSRPRRPQGRLGVGPASVDLVVQDQLSSVNLVDPRLCPAKFVDNLFIATASRTDEPSYDALNCLPGNPDAVRSDVLDNYTHEESEQEEDELQE
jgi:hypothetical protein